jgi:16S rRNA (cytosine1402-N4)-methyltransferase
MHIPVMPDEVLSALALERGACAVEGTCGYGGHTRLLAEAVGETGRVYTCDRDGQALAAARESLGGYSDRIVFLRARFSGLLDAVRGAGCGAADGFLADLGVSMPQLTEGERGFSLLRDGPLDMRLDQEEDTPTAADLVNRLSERELADLIYAHTGERRSRTISRALCKARPMYTMREFASALSALPYAGRLHPGTLAALSLRIEVNREYEEIEALLEALPRLVRPGGRAAVITFHSGEDRIVKTGFRRLAQAGAARLVNKHVITPGRAEILRNAASRSAKLRVIEFCEADEAARRGRKERPAWGIKSEEKGDRDE